MTDVVQKIEQIGIVPVIKIGDAKMAVPLAKALVRGGIPAAEVTFRTAAGEDAIRQIAAECPDILVGAGTVLNISQCERAVVAGAKFIVCPGYDEKLVAYCQGKGILILPGCSCPSDISKAVNAGLSVIKFFPAEQSGGIDYIRAIAPVYPGLRFMPTGGINAKNLNQYLSFDRIVACGGSWMVKENLLAENQFDKIEALCAEAMQTMLGFELAHIDIHAENMQEAQRAANMFSALFGFSVREGNSAFCIGTEVEVMKQSHLGRHGHIGIATNHASRARAYLAAKGFAFAEDTAKYFSSGKLKAIYLKDEICGFAVHLIEKTE